MAAPKITLAPLLNVRDGAKAIDFYKAAFGATVNFSTPPESGSVVANLSIGGARILARRRVGRTPEQSRDAQRK